MNEELKAQIEASNLLIAESARPWKTATPEDRAMLAQILVNQVTIIKTLDDLMTGKKSVRSRNNDPF